MRVCAHIYACTHACTALGMDVFHGRGRLCHGAVVPWCRGAVVPWYHGAVVPWCRGAMVLWVWQTCHGARRLFDPCVTCHEINIFFRVFLCLKQCLISLVYSIVRSSTFNSVFNSMLRVRSGSEDPIGPPTYCQTYYPTMLLNIPPPDVAAGTCATTF